VIELEPAISLVLGVPSRTPADDRYRPRGAATFFHLNVVVYGLVLTLEFAVARVTGP
jgi:hypothetical protein